MSEELMSSVLDNEGSTVDDEGLGGASDDSGSASIDPKAFEELSKSVNGINSLVGKWGNEMGEIRELIGGMQQVPSQPEPAGQSDDVLSKLLENPDAAISEAVSKALENRQTQEQQQIKATRDGLNQYAPDFDEYSDEIADALAQDVGGTAEDKQRMKGQLMNLSVPVLFNAYKRVKAEKELKQAKSLLDSLQSSGSLDMDAAKRAMARSHSSGDSASTTGDGGAPLKNPRDLSDDQLNALMKKRGIL